MRLIISVSIFLAMSGCGLFDSGVVWKGGPYILGWIDIPENVTVSYDLGNGNSIGRIDECVFSVGWNGEYLVAKQHPGCDKKLTYFYIIDAKKDNSDADLSKVVIGPLSEAQYLVKSGELKLPVFTKTLASLK